MKSNKIKPNNNSYCIWYDDLGKAHYALYVEIYDSFQDEQSGFLTPRKEVVNWKYQ
jgi:hypothetical protein